jgi:hypothetical protein
LLFKFIFSKSGVSNIRISLENFNCIFKSLKCRSKRLSFLSNSLGLTKRLLELLILVNLGIELKLKSLLRGLHKEVSNGLRDGISNVSDCNLEVSINSSSYFSHKKVGTFAQIVLSRGSLLRRLLTILTWLLLLLLLLLGYDISSIGKVITIICEMIVLLSINNGFNQATSLLSLLLEDSDYNVHNFRDE